MYVSRNVHLLCVWGVRIHKMATCVLMMASQNNQGEKTMTKAKKTTKTTVATVAKPTNAKPIKVLYGYIVEHSKKDPTTRDNRVFLTNDDAVKGDIFCVWANDKLKYFKVSKVQQKFEYVKADNGGVSLSDLRYVIQKLDLKSYNVLKAFGAKRTKADTTNLIKSLKGESKADVEALVAAIEALKANPESALD